MFVKFQASYLKRGNLKNFKRTFEKYNFRSVNFLWFNNSKLAQIYFIKQIEFQGYPRFDHIIKFQGRNCPKSWDPWTSQIYPDNVTLSRKDYDLKNFRKSGVDFHWAVWANIFHRFLGNKNFSNVKLCKMVFDKFFFLLKKLKTKLFSR